MSFFKAIYIFLLLIINCLFLSSQTWLTEDCSTANNENPPENWTSTTAESASFEEVWRWDNPGNRTLPFPMEAPFAIFDSDYFGDGILEEHAFWISPIIDLTQANEAILEFDHQFRYWENNRGLVEIRTDGDWQAIYTTPEQNVGFHLNVDSNQVIAETFDLTAVIGAATEMQVRFTYQGDWGYWWAIDNIHVFSPSPEEVFDLNFLELNTNHSSICWNPEIDFSFLFQNVGAEIPLGTTMEILLILNQEDTVSYEYLFDAPFLNGEVALLEDIVSIENNLMENVEVQGILEYGLGSLDLNIESSGAALPINNDLEFTEEEYYEDWLDLDLIQVLQSPTGEAGDWQKGTFVNDEKHLFGRSKKISLNNETENSFWASPFFLIEETSQLRFDYAITEEGNSVLQSLGFNEHLYLLVFLECEEGAIFADTLWTANDSIGFELIALEEYAGQIVRIAFNVDNEESNNLIPKDLFIDNVHLFNEPYQDLSLVNPIALLNLPCLMEEEILTVQMTNLGLETVNINQDDFFQLFFEDETSESFPANFTLSPNDTISVELGTITVPSSLVNFSLKINPEEALPFDLIFNNQIEFQLETSEVLSLPLLIDFEEGFNEDLLSEFEMEDLAFFENNVANENALSYSFEFEDSENRLLTNPILIEENTFLFFDFSLFDFSTDSMTWFAENQSFKILSSNDCGLTFNELAVYNVESEMMGRDTIDLQELGGEALIFAFQSQGVGAEETRLFLDNIEVKRLFNKDLALLDLVDPNTNLFCFNETEILTFSIRNEGLENISFGGEELNFYLSVLFPDSTFIDTIYQVNPISILSGNTLEIETPEALGFSQKGTYELTAFVELSEDENGLNDTLSSLFFINNDLDFDLIYGIDFEEYDGENLSDIENKWQEKSGALQPDLSSTDSDWNADYFANDPNNDNELSAHINLYQNNKNAWLIGPRIFVSDTTSLIFDLALTQWAGTDSAFLGSDDQFSVMLSTDCGESFFSIKTYGQNDTISPLGQTDTIALSDYEGSEVMLAFYVTDGQIDDEADTELFLDNIYIDGLFLPPGDIGVSAMVSPLPEICEAEQSSIAVRVTNYSNRKISNFMVMAEVTGAVDTFLMDTVLTPVEAQGGDLTVFQIQNVFGDSLFVKAWSILLEDTNLSNDTFYSATKIHPYPKLNLVEDTIVCGTLNYFPPIDGPVTNCSWSNGDTSHLLTTDKSDLYILTAKNTTCTRRDSINVEILPAPEAQFTIYEDSLAVQLFESSINNQSIQWLINGETFIDTIPSPYTFSDTGLYEIALLATDSLCGTDTLIQEVFFFLEEEEWVLGENSLNFSINNFAQIAPNPSNGNCLLSFKNPSAQKIEISIFDAEGKLEKNYFSRMDHTMLNLQFLESGYYVAKIRLIGEKQFVSSIPFIIY